MVSEDFSPIILAWYHKHKRDLPWRKTSEPYLIWLSEIILQQTRVVQGLPYYLKFAQAFPTLESLAIAREDQVLRLWQGLGYYSRARNMHKCARLLVEDYGGAFPRSYLELMKLPGIGRYTAAAIASLAFDLAAPAIDGNAYRVLSRVFGLETDIASAGAFKEFYQLGASLIDETQPGDFNQAVMEFGASVCTPKTPACSGCIFQDNCEANIRGHQQLLPVNSKNIKKRTRYFHYVIFKAGDRLALKQRSKGDIWQGLFDFHLIESSRPLGWDELYSELLRELAGTQIMIADDSAPAKHILTHQTLVTRFWQAEISDSTTNRHILARNGLTLYNRYEIEQLAKPVLITKYLNKRLISIDL